MAEVLVQFTDPVSANGTAYWACACGGPTADGLWQGWIEFTPSEGGRTIRSRRETTQPNRADAVYWATGLTTVYLEGALQRALNPPARASRDDAPIPAFDGPAPDTIDPSSQPDAILDPYAVYRSGEEMLRRRLNALSGWHLVNIIRAYGLSEITAQQLNAIPEAALAEMIVDAVRHVEPPLSARTRRLG